jgi:hypothetical protein
MNLDPFTFGDSIAAQVLADRLNEINNPNTLSTVSKFIQSNQIAINGIGTIWNSQARASVAIVYREEIHRRLAKSTTIPEKLKSYIANILIGKIKAILDGCV